jgi:hypothetical protein
MWRRSFSLWGSNVDDWPVRILMIRKLKSGEYRLYSRKIDPKTGKRRNLAPSQRMLRRKSMNGQCNFSNGTVETVKPSLHISALGRCNGSVLTGRCSKAMSGGPLKFVVIADLV